MYDEFENITGFDLETFFNRFVVFINEQSQLIIDYYSGLSDNIDRDAYSEYLYLYNNIDYVINLFDLNKERFNTVNFWQLMDFADDIKIKLMTIGNFSKFARSSVKKESFSSEVSVDVRLRKYETIEELSSRFGSKDRESDWIDIALSNSLIQEDYTPEGGVVLGITLKNNYRFFIDSIVDYPQGERIKGKDVNKWINFVNDDLEVLNYNDTLNQSINILANLRKNDNPEFPSYGIDKGVILGMSFKQASIPSIIRQLYQTFSTDDVVKKIEVLNYNFDSDIIYMDFNVIIKSGEEQKATLSA